MNLLNETPTRSQAIAAAALAALAMVIAFCGAVVTADVAGIEASPMR